MRMRMRDGGNFYLSKYLKGFVPDKYKITKMSRVLRWKHGRLKGWSIDGKGGILCEYDADYRPQSRIRGKKKSYRQVLLLAGQRLQWLYVHRLMAHSWLETPVSPLKFIVDHKNGDSLCNRIENLRWVTITANNINKKCLGLVETVKGFSPRIAGYVHHKYCTPDMELAKTLRTLLVECYVRYNSRFPGYGSEFPHKCIHNY